MRFIKLGMIGIMIAALTAQPGCSFLFVNGPPDNHAKLPTWDCSDSNAWPVVDVIWAALNGIGAASASGGDQTTNAQGDMVSSSTVVAVGVAWLVVSGVSAIYGFKKVS